jgi:predicted transcriptional regulator of viral defense system
MASDGRLERMGHGVYRLRGAPEVDHLQLRVAWLQLNPAAPGWERTTDSGVVSHRSAADLYGLGHLPAEVHEFTLSVRRQSRRSDVRLHRGRIQDGEWIQMRGLLVTRPARIAADLLADGEDPQAVAHVIADALREAKDDPGTTAVAIARHADRQGLRAGDGLGLLAWLLELTGDPNRQTWLRKAAGHGARV